MNPGRLLLLLGLRTGLRGLPRLPEASSSTRAGPRAWCATTSGAGTNSAARAPSASSAGAYLDVLGREVDPEGLRHFRHNLLEKNWTEGDVRDALRRSDEFRKKGGGR